MQCANMAMCTYSCSMWKYGSVEAVWKYVSVEVQVWQCGGLAVWKSGNVTFALPDSINFHTTRPPHVVENIVESLFHKRDASVCL